MASHSLVDDGEVRDFVATGNKVFNGKKTYRDGIYNWEKIEFDRWTVDNPSQTVPRANSGGAGEEKVSDYFIEDGSFVRLRTVAIGVALASSAALAAIVALEIWLRATVGSLQVTFSCLRALAACQ